MGYTLLIDAFVEACTLSYRPRNTLFAQISAETANRKACCGARCRRVQNFVSGCIQAHTPLGTTSLALHPFNFYAADYFRSLPLRTALTACLAEINILDYRLSVRQRSGVTQFQNRRGWRDHTAGDEPRPARFMSASSLQSIIATARRHDHCPMNSWR